MNAAAAMVDEEASDMRERRCIVTGAVMPEDKLVRFAVGPDARVVPDIAARLPGRGIWVSASRAAIDRAVAKNLFAKAAKANVKADTGLADVTEAQLVRRIGELLGLARRAGALVLGFDNVARALAAKVPPALLIEASDGALDGRRKLVQTAAARSREPAVFSALSVAELGLALGRENVVHAALLPGGFAERLSFEASRLEGFRPRGSSAGEAGPNPAHERSE